MKSALPRLTLQLLVLVWGLQCLTGCAYLQVLWYRPAASSSDHRIALTLDDGPNGVATQHVLEVLRQHQVPAIFFLIGKNVARDPALARRIVAEGHAVGNHSYGHEIFLAFYSTARLRHNLEQTNALITTATGVRPRYFRPPNGVLTPPLQRVCAELGLTPVGVHLFVNDSFLRDPDHIVQRVLKRLHGGPLILVLHDGFGTHQAPSRTVVATALERLIPAVQDMGYQWVPLDHIISNPVKSVPLPAP